MFWIKNHYWIRFPISDRRTRGLLLFNQMCGHTFWFIFDPISSSICFVKCISMNHSEIRARAMISDLSINNPLCVLFNSVKYDILFNNKRMLCTQLTVTKTNSTERRLHFNEFYCCSVCRNVFRVEREWKMVFFLLYNELINIILCQRIELDRFLFFLTQRAFFIFRLMQSENAPRRL